MTSAAGLCFGNGPVAKSIGLGMRRDPSRPAGVTTANLDKRLHCASCQSSIFGFGTCAVMQTRRHSNRWHRRHDNKVNDSRRLPGLQPARSPTDADLSLPVTMQLQQMKTVYLDHDFHRRRLQHVKRRIGAINRRDLETELQNVERMRKDKAKRNEVIVEEMTELRQRYSQQRRSRVRRSYVSLTALDENEAERAVYGLPRPGAELCGLPRITATPQTKARHLWQQASKRTNAVLRMLKHSRTINVSRDSNGTSQGSQ